MIRRPIAVVITKNDGIWTAKVSTIDSGNDVAEFTADAIAGPVSALTRCLDRIEESNERYNDTVPG